MKFQPLRKWDREVRVCGAGLLAMATLLLALLHRGQVARTGNPPTPTELCIALIVVCAGSAGACLLFVGRHVFQPVERPSHRRTSDRETVRGDR